MTDCILKVPLLGRMNAFVLINTTIGMATRSLTSPDVVQVITVADPALHTVPLPGYSLLLFLSFFLPSTIRCCSPARLFFVFPQDRLLFFRSLLWRRLAQDVITPFVVLLVDWLIHFFIRL